MSDQSNIESNRNRVALVLIVVAALAQTILASIYWSVIYTRAGYETIGYVIAGSGVILVARLFQNFRKETQFHFGVPVALCLAGALICNTLLFVFADPLIYFLLGTEFLPAAPLLRIMGITILLISIKEYLITPN